MSATKGPEIAAEEKPRRIHATPTKDFFVNMITRDISLQDCILDLLDNSIDGARRGVNSFLDNYLAGYWTRIEPAHDRFRITDNCGGIRLSDAIDYAFHFGRRAGSPSDVKGGIGLYGIGMKRAIFKIGRKAEVLSEAEDAAFRVMVDVDDWIRDEKDWDFTYDDQPRTGTRGTNVSISALNASATTTFGDPTFRNALMSAIARDYSFFISKGFDIYVGDLKVPSYEYALKTSSELTPAVESYQDDGVSVRLAAGLIDDLPDDIPDEIRPRDVDRYGWFVVCNDRVVLPADKTSRSIWGVDNYRVWHPQYNGFAGFAFFAADDQRRLPWTTTKRDLDVSSPVYQRAVVRMKAITDAFIEYTNFRKTDLEGAKQAERADAQIDVYKLTQPRAGVLPKLRGGAEREDLVTIAYQRPRRQIDQIKRHLGRIGMTAKDVGKFTFDYYRKSELGE